MADWRNFLGLALIGAGGGNPLQALIAKQQMQQDAKDRTAREQYGLRLSQTMQPQAFPSPTGPGNAAPMTGYTSPDPMQVASVLAQAPDGFNASPILSALTLQQNAQSAAQNLAFRQQQFGEDRRQFDVGQSGLNQRSADALAAEQARQQSQRDFTRGENALSREASERNARIRAESQLGTAGNVQSVQQVLLPDGRAGLLKIYRNGQTETTTMDGQPVISSSRDQQALFNQSAASASGRAAGTQAEALPTIDANFKVINDTLASFDEPAVKAQASRALGLGGYLPEIPGVNTDFIARAKQLQGQTFLQAYNTLKGGGQITEVEGEKATQSIARLNRSQTVSEFYNALAEAKKTFGDIYDSARTRGERGAVVPQMQTPRPDSGGEWKTLPNGIKIREKR